jgi:Na+/phosphate symporter
MERMEEMGDLYEKLLQQITLYNQYKNNIDFEKAQKLSKLLMDINNLAIKVGVYRGDVEAELNAMETKLRSEERNKSIAFI